jgi:hypothetical protein
VSFIERLSYIILGILKLDRLSLFKEPLHILEQRWLIIFEGENVIRSLVNNCGSNLFSAAFASIVTRTRSYENTA